MKSIPREKQSTLGWTTDYDLLSKISEQVLNLDGTGVGLEEIDGVIQVLAEMGFCELEPKP